MGEAMHVERHPHTVRSVLLSLLMVSLAQTAYIGALQGWIYPVLEDIKSDVRPAGGVSEVSSGGDVRLLLDPTNATSYGGSGTNFADLSGYNNNGTISGSTWDGSRYRFEMDGCTGSSAPYTCDDIKIPNSQSLRPGPTDEDLAVTLMTTGSSTATYLLGPSTSAGYDLGKVSTSFTISAWVKPTDCDETTNWRHVIRRENSYAIGCKSDQWTVALGSGTTWYGSVWYDTGVPAENDVWQHIALTRASSGSGVKFFLNGVEQYSVSSYEGNLGTTDQILQLGTKSDDGDTYTWRGEIDDLRIYTSDRSSTVADDMNEYPDVNDANLNAFFDFNQGRHGDTLANGVGAVNLAAGTGASSADLSSVTGSP
ncbi:MAG: LamG domain-containing protein, partial [Poseidonia sp.]